MAKGELFFSANIVKPLYTEIDRFLDGAIQTQLENIEANIAGWKEIIAEEEAVIRKKEELEACKLEEEKGSQESK